MVTTRERCKPPPPPPEPETRKSGRARQATKAYSPDTTVIGSATRNDAGPGKAKKNSKTNKKATKPKAIITARGRRPHDKNKRTITPKILTNPQTNEPVWIQTATLQDIQHATRRKRPPWPHHQRYLVTVPSLQTRQTVYATAAAALQELEERVLPTYGGRPWQCRVTLSERSKQKKSPYFVWHPRGRLELAAWPRLVEKMPTPPRFPGYYVGGGSSRSRKKAAVTASVEASGATEGDEDEAAEDEEDEEEEEVVPAEVAALHELQERESSGLSELAWNARHRVPLPTMTLKWISPLRQTFHTRKSAWEHAVQLCRQEIVLDKVLKGYGAHGKPLKLKQPHPRKTVMMAGKLRFERDGLWVVGQEEVWGLRRLEQEAAARSSATSSAEATAAAATQVVSGALEEKSAAAAATPKRRDLTGLSYFLQCHRDEHRQKRLQEFHDPPMDLPNPERTVTSLPNTPSTTIAGATASAVVTVTPPSESETKSSAIGTTLDLPSGMVANAPVNAPANSSTVRRQLSWSDSVAMPSSNKTSGNLPFTLRDAEQELRIVFKNLPKDEQQSWTAKAKVRQAELDQQQQDAMTLQRDVCKPVPWSPTALGRIGASNGEGNKSNAVSSAENGKTFAIVVEEDDASSPPHLGSVAAAVMEQSPQKSNPSGGSVVSASPTPHAVVDTDRGKAPPCKVVPAPQNREHAHKLAHFSRSLHWCLNQEQIQLCYDAGMEHYDQVMRTVTARGLFRELHDGFDMLRERGRGRFDMELPAFDSPEFSFLNDNKTAPWMPVVREILGKDAVLIHKGMFLSMPGSEKQNYHQDGTHLSSQYQRPCHAINVFVPLVNLTLENGPTEFCLGSHILDHEGFDERFVEIPTVRAGTPVIFDYRLGHRGLANASQTCRPIVYCTYAAAADGREFRDSVNFSRKRYHRIGDLVEKGTTREERAVKRKRALEELLEQQELELVQTAMSHQQGASCVDTCIASNKKPRQPDDGASTR